MQLRIATCMTLPEPDPDRAPLDAALGRAGVEFAWVAWDDNTYDYGGDGQRSPLGYGATDIEAVRELMTQIEEQRDAES